MRTFDLIECADFLKVDRNTAMKLAGTGELPGAKIGRAWVFLEDDVVAFLRKRTQEQSLARLQGAHEPETDARVAKAIAKQFATADLRRPGRRARPLPTLSVDASAGN
ncbi:helix-turn-helix domain-containing protein [Paraburkholderia xenovorans]|uniref:helix-turn-helix domain-containing protein n=1 Tax=Paraburkholderia xenovorans TaxID=36873 RepID=UPI0038B95874